MDQLFFEETVKEILSIDSPSGFTAKVIDKIVAITASLGYTMQRTNKGNAYIQIKGHDMGKTIGFSTHVDTLGLMVRSIQTNGHLSLTAIGSPIIPTLDGEYCRIYTRRGECFTGTIVSKHPAAHVYPQAQSDIRTIDTIEVRLDHIVRTKEDVQALGINAGDFVCYDAKTVITETGFVKSRFIDDKVSVALLLTLLKYWRDIDFTPANQVVCLFSTYEEVGHGMATLPVPVDELISVDMGCVGLDLQCTEYDVSICAKDSSGPYDYEITSKFIRLAQQHGIQHAVDIYPFYGSDTSAALRGGNDVRGGLIGPGVYASHGMERTHYQAVEATMQLLHRYVQE